MATVEVIQGDITTLSVDAIVNAANTRLAGGGGVDGAIHRAAGSELLVECLALGGCATGQAKITNAYLLPCQWVIHTVGPIWAGGLADEAELLASCYRQSLQLAMEYDISTIAFPAISCGIYAYPVDQAVEIAVTAVQEALSEADIDRVIFTCFNDGLAELYQQRLSR